MSDWKDKHLEPALPPLFIGIALLIMSWAVTDPFVGWMLTCAGHGLCILSIVMCVVLHARHMLRGR